MNVTTATPAEIDTLLAELYRRAGSAEQKIAAAENLLHYALDERKGYVGRRHVWPTTTGQALEAVRAKVADPSYTEVPWGTSPAKSLAAYDAAVAALEAIEAQAAPLNDEYARRPWSRFFVVQQNNGHIHSSMRCSTCNRGQYATQFGWNPELSGLSEAEALAKFDKRAHILCTVCFPNAPVEWQTAGKKSDHCEGSRKAPIEGSTTRTGMRAYGACTKCTDRPLLTQYGAVRAHKPKEPREVAATPEAPAAEAAPVVDQADEPAAPAEAPTARRIPGGRPTTAQARFLAALPADGSLSKDAMGAVSTHAPITAAIARGWAIQEPWEDGSGRVQHRTTADGLWAIGREAEAAALRSVELAAAADRARTGDRFADGTAAAREALAIAGEQDQADEQPAGAAFPECPLNDGHAGLCAVAPAPAAVRPRNIRDLALRLVDAVRAGDTAEAQRIDDELTGRLVTIEAAALTTARLVEHLPIQHQGEERPALAILTAVHGEPQACRCPVGTHLDACYWGTPEARQASARSWSEAEDEDGW